VARRENCSNAKPGNPVITTLNTIRRNPAVGCKWSDAMKRLCNIIAVVTLAALVARAFGVTWKH